ncbi:hypothetical protein AB0F93_00365 [Micromonospora tulbaghiae]|uniref:hypothetical protein n=1 Tax=Micromonospora tulbaghiae TaxID=479978 RepID=UPI00331E3F7C
MLRISDREVELTDTELKLHERFRESLTPGVDPAEAWDELFGRFGLLTRARCVMEQPEFRAWMVDGAHLSRYVRPAVLRSVAERDPLSRPGSYGWRVTDVVEPTWSGRVLLAAVEEMADMLGVLTSGDVLGGLTCRETDAIARVLAVGGHEVAAVNVILGHAYGDVPSDSHHQIRAVFDQVGDSEDLAVMEAAETYVRDLVTAHLDSVSPSEPVAEASGVTSAS